MVALLSRAWLILSDSGGLQEEAPALGRPLLVLRDVTERPDALDCAGIELVGTDPERIVAAVRRLHEEPGRHAEMARPRFPFGDGEAAPRIAAVIGEYLSGKETLQPPPSARVIG
jgi:UDP-N-acetylglucosamine 2-epimerase (non-hydrolysing)